MDREELYENIQDINARLTHLEDTSLDIRDVMLKLVKQGNQIVQFLKGVDDITDDYLNETSYKMDNKKVKEMKALVDEYLDKQQDLVEFEKEMKKHKDKLTLNIKGES
jgi:hypothetical protein